MMRADDACVRRVLTGEARELRARLATLPTRRTAERVRVLRELKQTEREIEALDRGAHRRVR